MYKRLAKGRLSDLILAIRLIQRSVHFTAAELPRPLAPSALNENSANKGDAEERKPNEEERRVPLSSEYKLHRLTEGPETKVTLTKSEAALYYNQLQSIRRLEAAASQLYKERIVRGFCHLYTGQEACAVGMRAALRPQDNVITAYRVHGWAYLMGISALGVLAELTGRQTGCARGKGGSMHMYAPHFYGGNGIVGAQVPLGTGLALASKYRGDGGVCLALYGDGAAQQGQVHECFNMAQLWQLPVVFVCENNDYGMGTKAERAASNTKFYTRGDLLPGIWVDGMDVLAVRSATKYAIEFAQTRGPLLLELCTYRYSGHSMSDPGYSYRSREEVQAVRQQRDAISGFRDICQEHDLLSLDELARIETQARSEIQEAAQLARSDAELSEEHLWADVYARNMEPRLRGVHGYDLKHNSSQEESREELEEAICRA